MAGELSYDVVTGQLVYSPATGQLALDCVVAGEDCGFCTAGRTPANYTGTFHNATYPDIDGVAVVCAQDADPCTFYGQHVDSDNPGLPYRFRVSITAANTLLFSVRRWQGDGYGDIFLHAGADFTGVECDAVNLAALANQIGGGGTADVVAGP